MLLTFATYVADHVWLQVILAVLVAVITTLPLVPALRILAEDLTTTRPISVNYHFTRLCNKSCGFCFHTALTSHRETSDRAKAALHLLKKVGMRKLNFAGGEPFLAASFLGEMVDFAKQTLRLESVSIVSNGSLITEKWMSQHAHNLDILAVSCDSFDEEVNIAIGRGSGDQVTKLYQIKEWCVKFGVKFKINTVVCALNKDQDMNHHIQQLEPFRWKCFQVLEVKGENDGNDTLRSVDRFLITDEDYASFCKRHNQQPSFVPESNKVMAKSYLILDEYLRFLDRDGRSPSGCILDVGVKKALDSVFWDQKSFVERGGVFDWTREETGCKNDAAAKELEW
ncbi:hypothetical protein BDZ85DRAFT_126401 [Elsinoe ampelina]|uniref:Radical SAM core domain-containing protein n=1 Tax=Elsinoe ampelina TaxID=302913 RepID=A0A6A6G9G7_9PEZI|nr:hypothetical protein BDZ85DRAFT_126401 [Elsinoe ampelina]